MAWHHHIHKHIRRHSASFVMSHPYLSTLLGLVGISTIATVVAGKHATPSPAAQNKTVTPGVM